MAGQSATVANPLQWRVMSVADNVRRLRAEMEALSPSSVLIAVAKTFPAEAVREAAEAGIGDIGENYLQEAEAKIADCADLRLNWHFIGAIQRNKTAKIAELFDWVHGVDRLIIAERLSASRSGKSPLNCFLQVNIDDEPGKAGVNPAEAPALAGRLAELPNLRLRGLMVLPEARAEFDRQYECFARVKSLQNCIRQAGVELDCLSMGMSGDYPAALQAGATHIRIGTAIFGSRN